MLPVPVLVALTVPKEPDSTTSPVLEGERAGRDEGPPAVSCTQAWHPASITCTALSACTPSPFPAWSVCLSAIPGSSAVSPRLNVRDGLRLHARDIQPAGGKGGRGSEGGDHKAGDHKQLCPCRARVRKSEARLVNNLGRQIVGWLAAHSMVAHCRCRLRGMGVVMPGCWARQPAGQHPPGPWCDTACRAVAGSDTVSLMGRVVFKSCWVARCSTLLTTA